MHLCEPRGTGVHVRYLECVPAPGQNPIIFDDGIGPVIGRPSRDPSGAKYFQKVKFSNICPLRVGGVPRNRIGHLYRAGVALTALRSSLMVDHGNDARTWFSNAVGQLDEALWHEPCDAPQIKNDED